MGRRGSSGSASGADPALVDWCFVRLPNTPKNKTIFLEKIRAGIRTDENDDPYSYAATSMDDPETGWLSDNVYNLAVPVKGRATGDGSGNSRTALDDAVAQAFRGASGLTEFLTTLENRRLLATEKTDRGRNTRQVGYVLPAVFTTARLWASEVDLAASDIHTGKVVPVGPLRPMPWLWLKQSVSPDLKHSLDPADYTPFDSLREYLLRDYLRCVAIVGVDGIEPFLQKGEFSFFAAD